MSKLSINSKRILLNGWRSFVRNGWLSLATTSIMTWALMMAGLLFIINLMLSGTISFMEKKLDISVYFNEDVEPDFIVNVVKKDLEQLPEVVSVTFKHKDQSLAELQAKDSATITNTIKEIGKNPLSHILNIETISPKDHQIVQKYLTDKDQNVYGNKIRRIAVKKDVVQKVNRIADFIRTGGLIVSGFFIAITVLITFNAIRITIHNFKTEIDIMRLVGASSWFIRLPFMVEGLMYGLLASILTLVLLYSSVNYVSDKIDRFIPELELSKYFNSNAFFITVGFVLIGCIIGSFSSFIAIKRYLKEERIK